MTMSQILLLCDVADIERSYTLSQAAGLFWLELVIGERVQSIAVRLPDGSAY